MSNQKKLLLVDGVVNIILGILLLLVPLGSAEFFAAPRSNLDFYPTILGGVLLGIGVALVIEVYGEEKGFHGLGLEGAISINLIAASTLLFWLVYGNLGLAKWGAIFLWLVVVIVYAVSVLEIFLKSKLREK